MYSPESTQRRSSAARTTANGCVALLDQQQLEHRVAQVGGVEVLLALGEERRLVELGRSPEPLASFMCTRNATAGSWVASSPARSAESSDLRDHS